MAFRVPRRRGLECVVRQHPAEATPPTGDLLSEPPASAAHYLEIHIERLAIGLVAPAISDHERDLRPHHLGMPGHVGACPLFKHSAINIRQRDHERVDRFIRQPTGRPTRKYGGAVNWCVGASAGPRPFAFSSRSMSRHVWSSSRPDRSEIRQLGHLVPHVGSSGSRWTSMTSSPRSWILRRRPCGPPGRFQHPAAPLYRPPHSLARRRKLPAQRDPQYRER